MKCYWYCWIFETPTRLYLSRIYLNSAAFRNLGLCVISIGTNRIIESREKAAPNLEKVTDIPALELSILYNSLKIL